MIKKWLTSNYNKSPLSNVSKVSKIISDELEELKILYNTIETYNDVDIAEGKALDDIGSNIKQFRGEVRDEIYRALIKSKIARNKADGTLNNLLDVLSLALEVDKSTIKLKEGLNPLFASIEILEVPVDVLSQIGMSVSQLGRIINTMIAAGIRLESVVFEGTFAYVDELTTDIDLGYSDVNMTRGGTLGDIYQPAKDDNFPL